MVRRVLVKALHQLKNKATDYILSIEPRMGTVTKTPCPAWARHLDAVNSFFFFNLPGPRICKTNWVINSQKFSTVLWIYYLMVSYDRWDTAAWIWIACHGVYGYCWLLKSLTFPDHSFEGKVSPFSVVVQIAFLYGAYWPLDYWFMSQSLTNTTDLPVETLALAVALHTFGCCLCGMADLQVNITLSMRKGLINSGLFRYCRNPNYLGEVTIYLSYCILVGHWAAYATMGSVWFCLFYTRMLIKDESLSRYPEFAAWKATSGIFFPWIPSMIGDIFGGKRKRK